MHGQTPINFLSGPKLPPIQTTPTGEIEVPPAGGNGKRRSLVLGGAAREGARRKALVLGSATVRGGVIEPGQPPAGGDAKRESLVLGRATVQLCRGVLEPGEPPAGGDGKREALVLGRATVQLCSRAGVTIGGPPLSDSLPPFLAPARPGGGDTAPTPPPEAACAQGQLPKLRRVVDAAVAARLVTARNPSSDSSPGELSRKTTPGWQSLKSKFTYNPALGLTQVGSHRSPPRRRLRGVPGVSSFKHSMRNKANNDNSDQGDK